MKALTLHQPWATLIATGDKTYETRSWRTDYRGPLAIHASKTIPDYVWEWMISTQAVLTMLARAGYCVDDLPLGVVVATCQLVGVIPTERLDLSRLGKDRILGNFAPGRFAWELRDIMPVRPPRPARGSLGLWEWDEEAAGVTVMTTGRLF